MFQPTTQPVPITISGLDLTDLGIHQALHKSIENPTWTLVTRHIRFVSQWPSGVAAWGWK